MVSSWIVGLGLSMSGPSYAQEGSIVIKGSRSCIEAGDTSLIPDLTTNTRESLYNLYAASVNGIDDLLGGRYIPEIGQGMVIVSGFHGGTVWANEVDGDASHMVEHWFLDVTPAGYNGGGAFSLDLDPTGGWMVDTAKLQAGWSNDFYVFMNIQYRQVPDFSIFTPLNLGFANGPAPQTAILEGWAFDVHQDGVPMGHMLRERHADGKWVEYWLFTGDYAKISAESPSADVIPWGGQPANAAAFFSAIGPQNNYEHFAKITYKLRKGCAYNELLNQGAFEPFQP